LVQLYLQHENRIKQSNQLQS